MHGLAGQDPAHVRPPLAIDGRMRITFLIGELMMNAMRRHPEYRSAFQRQSRASGQEILDPLRRLVAAMCKQSVVAHADAEAARNPPEKHRYEESFPTEEEECGDRPHMKKGH